MGATRPQTLRRSPRQAFGGKWVLPHLGGKKAKQQNKLRIFSYEVSHSRGQVTSCQGGHRIKQGKMDFSRTFSGKRHRANRNAQTFSTCNATTDLLVLALIPDVQIVSFGRRKLMSLGERSAIPQTGQHHMSEQSRSRNIRSAVWKKDCLLKPPFPEREFIRRRR